MSKKEEHKRKLGTAEKALSATNQLLDHVNRNRYKEIAHKSLGSLNLKVNIEQNLFYAKRSMMHAVKVSLDLKFP